MTAHERAAVAEGPTRGCGQPGHVGWQADEGTAHCETCRAMAAEAALEHAEDLCRNISENIKSIFESRGQVAALIGGLTVERDNTAARVKELEKWKHMWGGLADDKYLPFLRAWVDRCVCDHCGQLMFGDPNAANGQEYICGGCIQGGQQSHTRPTPEKGGAE